MAGFLYERDLRAAEGSAVRILEAVRQTGVTVSIGIAVRVPGEKEGDTALLQAADGALYEAKRGGRDQYRVAGGSET
mgnify:CR=1 FL=1